MDAARITRFLRNAPHAPGVYFWRTTSGTPLYIGKAADLKNRLGQYRRPSDDRIAIMVEHARTLDWQQTQTEIEALILEAALIKRHRPRYNVMFRDDKSYTVVALTNEEFPHFLVTHQHQSTTLKKPIKELIGPFTESVPLRTTLRILRTLFPYCTCTQKHHVKCLNAHIGLCPGYCCLKAPARGTQRRAYRANVRAIRDILTGKRDAVIRRIEQRMKAHANAGKLEEALGLQRTAARLRRVFEHAKISARLQSLAARHEGALRATADALGLPDLPRRIEGYDVANIQGMHAAGAMVVFQDGSADPSAYRLFNIKDAVGDVPMLRQVAQRRLRHLEWPLPNLVVVDGGKAQFNALADAFAGHRIPVIAVQKDARHRPAFVVAAQGVPTPFESLPRPMRDLIAHVDQEAHRFCIAHYRARHRRGAAR
ncbi:MAG TPA: GIY-YIG nuclease family protein [Candidatus Paceibacterota bacterium]|nr:GIY-YIG nuclease family protein [Candidatus Paceibacterota bacterium]